MLDLALFFGVAPMVCAEISWDYAEQREQQMEEALKHREAIEAIHKRELAREAETKLPSLAESRAYAELGKALAAHPEMAAANAAEAKAIKEYQNAVAGGNELEVSLAQQTLAKAKAVRYQKALTVPELKQAIIKWQMAKVEAQYPPEDEGKARAAMETIQQKLKALGEVMGN